MRINAITLESDTRENLKHSQHATSCYDKWHAHSPNKPRFAGNGKNKTPSQTYLVGKPQGAMRSKLYHSRNSAHHGAYRSSLRPSSVLEPRHPPLQVTEVISC